MIQTKNIPKILAAIFVMALFLFASKNASAVVTCEITKTNGGGFTTTITSVEENQDGTYTIVLTVEHDGCGGPGCKELSHYSVEADPGTYSDISVNVISGGMTYGQIDYGPNLGSDPFDGFKIDGISGIGGGDAGVFTITYTLDELQDQQTSAKAGPNPQIAEFEEDDFEDVLECLEENENDPPEAEDDSNTTEVNTPVSGNVLTNDDDPNGDELEVSETLISGPSHGSVDIEEDGDYTYTPDNGYSGTDSFVYEVCDDADNSMCDEATVTITIIAGPTAVDDSETTDMNTPVDIDVLSNDQQGTAPLDPTTVEFVNGTEPNPGTEGTFTVNSNTGLVTFTPVNGFTGTVTVDYEVCDDNDLCDVATITVDVQTVQGPTANDDSETTQQDTPVDIDVLANDQEGDAPLDPSTVEFVNGTEPDPSTEGTYTVNNTTGIVTFTPVSSFTGSATIDYEVCDDNSLCDVATITVTVTGGGGNDSDGDGIPDGDDDYPNDPDRAFDNFYPPSGYGTLAYEDLWPGKGDYDFNDLVLDYKFQFVSNANNNVLEVFGTFIVRAYGATYHNGFGFEIITDQIDQSDLSVSGYNIQENYINLNSNGLEAGQTNPVFIVYDDAYNILPHPGEGIGVNTEESAPYVEPDSVMLTINVTPDTYSLSTFTGSTFNPFIIVDGQRDVEVHLPNHPPTDKADMSLFGTYHDDSNPQSGRYYKTQENLPWAIHIYESFAYPREKIEILDAYNYFDDWAESGGEQYPDWYQDNQGYRNDQNIYSND
ncbi:MAG: LruC domain-containing protein [Bacteroidales bacterium]|nr:LruC domain-containing protein [Bacteroidales bacterium]